MEGIALRPSDESHGYRIYIPSTHSIIDTTNYGTYKFTEPATPSTSDTNIFDYFFSTLNEPTIEDPPHSSPSSTHSQPLSSLSTQSEASSPNSPLPSPSTSYNSVNGGTTHDKSCPKLTTTTAQKSLRRSINNIFFSHVPTPKRHKTLTPSSTYQQRYWPIHHLTRSTIP